MLRQCTENRGERPAEVALAVYETQRDINVSKKRHCKKSLISPLVTW